LFSTSIAAKNSVTPLRGADPGKQPGWVHRAWCVVPEYGMAGWNETLLPNPISGGGTGAAAFAIAS